MGEQKNIKFDERKIELRKQIKDNIKFPFTVKLRKKLGDNEDVIERDTFDYLELKWFVNLTQFKLKTTKRVREEGVEIQVGSLHSGFYHVRLTLDEYAILYNMLKDIDEKLEKIDKGENIEEEIENF